MKKLLKKYLCCDDGEYSGGCLPSVNPAIRGAAIMTVNPDMYTNFLGTLTRPNYIDAPGSTIAFSYIIDTVAASSVRAVLKGPGMPDYINLPEVYAPNVWGIAAIPIGDPTGYNIISIQILAGATWIEIASATYTPYISNPFSRFKKSSYINNGTGYDFYLQNFNGYNAAAGTCKNATISAAIAPWKFFTKTAIADAACFSAYTLGTVITDYAQPMAGPIVGTLAKVNIPYAAYTAGKIAYVAPDYTLNDGRGNTSLLSTLIATLFAEPAVDLCAIDFGILV